MQGMLYDEVSQAAFYIQYDVTGTTFELVALYTDNSLTISNSYFTGLKEGFFVGSLNQFGALKTYNNDMGFILQIDPIRNCIEVGTSTTTETLILNNNDYVQNFAE